MEPFKKRLMDRVTSISSEFEAKLRALTEEIQKRAME
jgi:hypothetical protein